MIRKPQLVLVSFDELLEEITPLEDVFWFLDTSFKNFIASVLNNLSVEEGQSFRDLDLTNLMISLYGKPLSEFLLDAYYDTVETLARCNAKPVVDDLYDTLLIQFIADKTQSTIEQRLSEAFGSILFTDISDALPICWKSDKLIIPLKT